jgi:hypothetical protein
MPGEQFDASSDPGPPAAEKRLRPFVGVYFQCCGVYSRIHLNTAETAFSGHCPRCCRRIEFPISETGSHEQFFTVS